MQRYLYFILVLTITFTSCSKDQSVTNKIEGKWVVTGMTDTDMSNLNITMEFPACKTKDAPCHGTSTIVDSSPLFGGTTNTNFDYEVSDKGTKLTQTVISMTNDSLTWDCTVNCTTVTTIKNVEKDELIFEHTNDSGKVITTNLNRM